MKVLVACEESQRVCVAFRAKGHEAYSCDILDCSGKHPEWHIKTNVQEVMHKNIIFITGDSELHEINQWDLIIAHPPCTYLTVAANKYYDIAKYGNKALDRMRERARAINFFMDFTEVQCEKIAIENPIGVMSSFYKKPTQIIQPYQFGHPERKATCLWLKGLPKLQPTNIVEPDIIKHPSGRTDSRLHYETFKLPPKERSKMRSKTFEGIAKAMAEQWG